MSSITRRISQVAALAAVAFAGAALAPSAAQAQGTGNTCYACFECTQLDGSPGHYFDGSLAGPGQAGLTKPDEPFVCESGSCSDPTDNRHQPCTGAATAAVASLTAAARSGDMLRLASAVKAGGSIVEFNRARNAIQVVGCNGAIVAHIPVREEQFARLASTE